MPYRPSVPRIMSGTGIGVWTETVHDTIYRNPYGWLICRSRGKRNGGRITGQRFYVIARDGSMKPHKMRTAEGSVRYFDSAPAAAFAAVKYAQEKARAWERSKLVSEIEALELHKKNLLVDLDHLNKTKASLQTYVSRLNGIKTRLSAAVKAMGSQNSGVSGEDSTIVEESEDDAILQAQMQLPAWLRKTVTHVFRQGKPH